MGNRYLVLPENLEGKADIVSYVADLYKRAGDSDSALRIGHTAIEDGNLTVRNGDIIVSESDDTVVLRILHGDIPEIRFFPLGSVTTHRASLFAVDFAPDPEDTDQSVVLTIETDVFPTVQDGGKLLLSETSAILSHQPDASGGEESYLWLNYGFNEIANYRGRWSDQLQADAHQGLYMGAFNATAGFSTWTHTYFTPFSTTMVPLANVGVSGGTLTWGLDSYSASQFTLRFGVSGGTKMVTFWNFRI